MLNRTKMRAASESFRLLWWSTLQAGGMPQIAQGVVDMAMQIPSNDWKGLYRWFESLPIMRLWIGDRQAAKLKAEGFEVLMQPYESTIKVLRDDIKYDKLQGYGIAIRRMANELKLLPYRRLQAVLKDGWAGATFTCFDGYPLFSASHATGTNTSVLTCTATNLDALRKIMRQQTDPTNGDPLLIEPTHLWYHQDLEETVADILTVDRLASGASNKNFKSLIPVPIPGLTLATNWGLASLPAGEPMRPLLWQYDPAGGDFVAQDSPEDEANFNRRELKYGTEAWGAPACGFPQFIVGSTGAG